MLPVIPDLRLPDLRLEGAMMQVDCACSHGSPSSRRRGDGRRRQSIARLSAAVVLVLLCGAAGWPALAAVAPIGTAFSAVIDLEGKQIPLPQGEWVLVGDGFEIVPSVLGGAGDAVESVVLFRVEGKAVTAFIIAHRNTVGVDKGWGVASDCDRQDIHAAVTYDEADNHGLCGFVNHVVTASDDRSAESWKQAVAYAQARDLTLAPTWLMAGFRLSDAGDVVDVRYHFDPALAGMATPRATGWSDSKWSKSAVAGTPAASEGWGDAARRWAGYAAFWQSDLPGKPTARAVVVDDLVAWLDTMRFPVELGFKNRAGDMAALPMPWSTSRGEPPIDLTLRLKKVAELKARHVLTSEQYAEQRAIIDSEHGSVAGSRWTAEGLTTAKAFTNQITTNIAAFAADFWFTGNITTAISLVGIHTVADVGQYWSIEWLWNAFGPRRIEAVTLVDFAGAGIDRPSSPDAAPAVPTADGGGLVLGHAPTSGKATVTK
jgi:hypothetical protein